MSLRQWTKAGFGFSLIELMIAVTVIGVLTSIALPAYRIHMIKSRMAEVLLQANRYINMAEEYNAGGGGLCDAALGAKITAASVNATRYVSAVNSLNFTGSLGCSIQLVLNGPALGASDADATTNSISMTPSIINNNVIAWTCRYTDNASKTMAKYLPSQCLNP